MELIPSNPFLKFNSNANSDIKKLWNLDNGRTEQSVDILQEWIKKQKHFVKKNFSRECLINLLINCKGSIEKAKKQTDKLCTFRTLIPKQFSGGDDMKTMREIANLGCMIPLPQLTEDHYRIIVNQVYAKEFVSSLFINYYQLVIIAAEYMKAHDLSNGFIIIEDMRDVNVMEMVSKINIVEFQQFISILIEGYGARIKGIHILSQSKVIDILVKLLKSVLSAKMKDRIFVHQDLEELHKIVDKKIMPVEYGGEERSIEKLKEEWIDLICSDENKKYLDEAKTFCTDESLRPSDKYNEQIMGLPGSFRTLAVD